MDRRTGERNMVRLTYGVMILMIFLSQPAELLAQTISGELVRTAVENYIKKSVPADVDATIELRDLGSIMRFLKNNGRLRSLQQIPST